MAIEVATATTTTGRDQYRALAFRRTAILIVLVLALCFSMSLDMALGPANYPLSDVLSALLDPAAASDQLRVIIWDIRMPIALMAVTVGASLSVAGAQMQTIFSNPLASPFTLGSRPQPASVPRWHWWEASRCFRAQSSTWSRSMPS